MLSMSTSQRAEVVALAMQSGIAITAETTIKARRLRWLGTCCILLYDIYAYAQVLVIVVHMNRPDRLKLTYIYMSYTCNVFFPLNC